MTNSINNANLSHLLGTTPDGSDFIRVYTQGDMEELFTETEIAELAAGKTVLSDAILWVDMVKAARMALTN